MSNTDDLWFPYEDANRIERDPLLYQLQPTKDKAVGTNHLFILRFHLGSLEFFKGSAFYHFFAPLYVHFVKDGNRRQMVACPRRMSEQAKAMAASTAHSVPKSPLGDRCPLCDKAQKLWDVYQQIRKQVGAENLSTEVFRAVLNANPALAAARDNAKSWSATERFYFVVFDYAKASGRKPLDDVDEGVVRVQGMFGPKKLMTDLEFRRKAGKRFWDVEGGGLREVVIERDNSVSARFCTYKIEIADTPPTISEQVKQYLLTATPPDPSRWALVWTYDQLKEYASAVEHEAEEPRTAHSAPQPLFVPLEAAGLVTPPVAEAPSPVPPVAPSPTPGASVATAAPVGAPVPPPPPAGGVPSNLPHVDGLTPPPTVDAPPSVRRGKIKWR